MYIYIYVCVDLGAQLYCLWCVCVWACVLYVPSGTCTAGSTISFIIMGRHSGGNRDPMKWQTQPPGLTCVQWLPILRCSASGIGFLLLGFITWGFLPSKHVGICIWQACRYTSACIHMQVHIHRYPQLYACTCTVSTGMATLMPTCTHARMSAYMHACVHTCTHVYAHAPMQACICIPVYVYTWVYLHAWIHVHLHM